MKILNILDEGYVKTMRPILEEINKLEILIDEFNHKLIEDIEELNLTESEFFSLNENYLEFKNRDDIGELLSLNESNFTVHPYKFRVDKVPLIEAVKIGVLHDLLLETLGVSKEYDDELERFTDFFGGLDETNVNEGYLELTKEGQKFATKNHYRVKRLFENQDYVLNEGNMKESLIKRFISNEYLKILNELK